jgi:hypothetical protein
MKRAEEKRIISLSEFDNEVSLYQLLPAGSGRALRLLRYVVDYIHTTHPDRIPSIIITGEQGVSTHARCYLRALGIEDIRLLEATLNAIWR